MKPKYIRERLNGEMVYPDCPEVIKSKEDLQRWFEHTDQYFDLLSRLPDGCIKEQTYEKIVIMFLRCKYSASVFFTHNECYKIAL